MNKTVKRTGAVVFAAGLVLASPMASATAQSALSDAGSSMDAPEPDMQRLPTWAFEALHFGPTTAAEVEECWDEQGDVIILIYPPPCPDGPISGIEYHAANALWFFTSRLGGS